MKKTRADRRRAKGRLSDLRVSAKVRQRYFHAVQALLYFWRATSSGPEHSEDFDRAASCFIEAQWHEGESAYICNNALAGLQFYLPVKGKLKSSWHLLKTWHKLEPASRVLPIHPLLVMGIAGLISRIGFISAAACLLIGFDCFLRSSEIYNLERRDITFYKDKAVLKLRDTKTGKRTGNSEMVVCQSPFATSLLKLACQDLELQDKVLRIKPKKFRELLVGGAAVFGFSERINTYSLRRGGATWSFLQHGSMELVLLRGRWQSTATARIYLQDAVASLSDLQLSDEVRDRLGRHIFYLKGLT